MKETNGLQNRVTPHQTSKSNLSETGLAIPRETDEDSESSSVDFEKMTIPGAGCKNICSESKFKQKDCQGKQRSN